MSPKKPSGICTQLYRCTNKHCGAEWYQPPGAEVIHPCTKTKRSPMKEVHE